MTAVFLELGKLALLAGFAFPWFVGWATLMERFGSCPDCRKGAKCAACLAASEAIRPTTPQPRKEGS